MKNSEILIGCHVGMNAKNEYLIGTVKEAIENDCDTFMFFTGAPQNTRRTETSKLNIDAFQKIVKENGFDIKNIIVHGPYTINLANSVKPETFELGVRLLKEEILRLEEIGIEILVLHPGAAVGAEPTAALEKLASGLNEVLNSLDTTVKIALETMSGKGTEIGINFDQLKYVIDRVEKKQNIGVCFDTCHMWDSGMDIVNEFDQILDEFDQKIGIDKILAMHINDSKNIMGSGKDRHNNIGYGEIGFEAIQNIIYNTKLSKIPKVLETPWVGELSPYKREIEIIRKNKWYDWINIK